MDRKAMARETLDILSRGYYEPADNNKTGQTSEKRQIILKDDMEHSIQCSTLITPAEGENILEKYHAGTKCAGPDTKVENISTVGAIRMLVNASSSGNIKPGMVMEAFSAFAGVEIPPGAYRIIKLETYMDPAADDKDRQGSHRWIPLDAVQ